MMKGFAEQLIVKRGCVPREGDARPVYVCMFSGTELDRSKLKGDVHGEGGVIRICYCYCYCYIM